MGIVFLAIDGKLDEGLAKYDWRFCEFPNAVSFVVHVTAVELMALPLPGSDIGQALLNLILKKLFALFSRDACWELDLSCDACTCSNGVIPRGDIMKWINAVALLLTSLPESYWVVVHDQIVKTVSELPSLIPPNTSDFFAAFNFKNNHSAMSEQPYNYVIALTHAIWLHASIGQATLVPVYV